MKYKIARIILVAFIVVVACIMFFACGLKPTNAETSQVDSYELHILNDDCGESKLILYNTYKVKSENISSTAYYGNAIVTYNTTDGTRIIFADNGVTVISPKGYTESFTEGYMRRKIGDNNEHKEKE